MASTQSITWFALLGFLWMTFHGAQGDLDWDYANATFFNGRDTSRVLGNGCGYGIAYSRCFGQNTAAISTALFNDGLACGTCYEISCDSRYQWCTPHIVTVSATNKCPPNTSLPYDNGGWCNPPMKHFVLSQSAFLQIANKQPGVIPIKYRRVHCKRRGGILFTMLNGHSSSNLVLVSNIGGTGDISAVSIKGSVHTDWEPMTRRWGQIWQSKSYLNAETLSFEVTSGDKEVVVSDDVVPSNWKIGQTFEGGQF